MASPLASYLGFAFQTAKGTAVTTTANYTYLPFTGASVGPIGMRRPLPVEAGGVPTIRDVVTTGFYAGGSLDFVPRVSGIGVLLKAALGFASVSGTGPYTHTFTWNASDFTSIPYLSIMRRVSSLGWERMADSRLDTLVINAQASDIVTASAAFVGLKPSVVTSTWAAGTLDATNPFISCTSALTSPDSNITLKPIAASLTIANGLTVNNEFIIGSYYPDDVDVAMRTVTIRLVTRLDDYNTYRQAMYGTVSSTDPSVTPLKSTSFTMTLKTVTAANTESLVISVDSGGNTVWAAEPVVNSAGDTTQMMVLNGTFIMTGNSSPIKAVLQNARSDYN